MSMMLNESVQTGAKLFEGYVPQPGVFDEYFSGPGQFRPHARRFFDELNALPLDELVRRQVLSEFDHRNLNTEVGRFADEVPTSENLAVEICRRLKANWRAVFPGEWPKLDKVRIGETRKNIFEVRADEIE